MKKHNHYLDIKGFDGKYQINRDGQVRDISSEPSQLLAIDLSPFGNPYVRLEKVSQSGQKEEFIAEIRNLIAQHFFPKPQQFDILIHKDFNKQNVSASNLEWTHLSIGLLHIIESIKRSLGVRLSEELISAIHLFPEEKFMKKAAKETGLNFDLIKLVRHHIYWAELKWLYYDMTHPSTGKRIGWQSIRRTEAFLHDIRLELECDFVPMEQPLLARALHHAGSIWAYEY